MDMITRWDGMGYYNVNEHGLDVTTFRVHGSGGYYNVFWQHIRDGWDYNVFSEHRKGAFAAALDALPPHA